jgi:hypothetical protein
VLLYVLHTMFCKIQYVDHLRRSLYHFSFFWSTQLLLPKKEESANCLIRLLLILK